MLVLQLFQSITVVEGQLNCTARVDLVAPPAMSVGKFSSIATDKAGLCEVKLLLY